MPLGSSRHIEAVLRGHDAVSEACVVAVRDGVSHHQLVAYVVAAPGTSPAGTELRAYLDERLPAQLRISAFVPIDRLPRTLSGKVDKAQLPPVTPEDGAAGRVAPRDDTERAVAQVWQQVLSRTEVMSCRRASSRSGAPSSWPPGCLLPARRRMHCRPAVFDAPTIPSLRSSRHPRGGREQPGPGCTPGSRDAL